MKPLVFDRPVPCRSPRDAIWLALADSHRLNRAIGNHPLQSEPMTAGASRFLVRTRLAGLHLRYEEEPFEWCRPESIAITRRFQNGPAASYTYQLFLREVDSGGCRADVRLTVYPRHFLFRPFVYINTAAVMRALIREVKAVDERLRSGRLPFLDPPKTAVRKTACERAMRELQQNVPRSQQAVVTRLAEHINEAADAEVSRMRPFALADRWRCDRRDTLTVFLRGVLAGLLELSWDIICPSCRTVASQLESLDALQATSHCHFCDLSIGIDLDRAVEATFRPSPSVRPTDELPYCIGGPFRTPHVVTQRILPARERVTLKTPAAEGRYRVFVRGGAVASVSVDAAAVRSVELRVDEQIHPNHVSVAPSGELHVVDATGQARHVKLEHLEWASEAATAVDVSTLNVFREFFSSQVLQPGLGIKIGRVALIFTDLTGSTAMYTSQGDALAYRFVMDHFVVLRQVIESQHGTLVKTIGDAVMAAFADEIDAVRASSLMQQRFCRFAAERYPLLEMGLRVGLYCGPCYSINANNTLDYFGQAVNIASRLESQAEAGEVVLPMELFRKAVAEKALREGENAEEFAASLKGIAQPLPAVRIRIGTKQFARNDGA